MNPTTLSLFPDNNARLIDGFRYEQDFLTEGEEQQLLDYVSGLDLHAFRFQGFEAKRRVTSFGVDYSFDSRKLSPGQEIPREFQPLIMRVAAFLSMDAKAFAELLVTEYPPGAVINWHRDAPPFDIVVGISLLEDCIFKLRPHDKQKQGKKSIISLPVGRRSLYCMQGEAREAWEHSTAPVKKTRYSITLRTLKH